MQRVLRRRTAFTLIELLVVIAIIAILIGILLPALAHAKKISRMTICGNHLRELGQAANSYSTEFQDKIFSFTWDRTHGSSKWNDLETQRRSGTGTAPASAQAIDIIRRRAGREDMQVMPSWIPHVLYTHLVLQDYLASRLPEKLVACPEDRYRLDWQQQNGKRYNRGDFLPYQPAPAGLGARWPYSASYQTPPATYDFWASKLGTPPATWAMRVTQAASDGFYQVHQRAKLGGLLLGDVKFPSQKVLYMDQEARHFGKTFTYYAFEESRQPLLSFDGSVNVWYTRDTNRGWNPGQQNRQNVVMRFQYDPDLWEAPLRNGTWDGTETVTGYYRWTRGGLEGIDFGSSEIRTGT